MKLIAQQVQPEQPPQIRPQPVLDLATSLGVDRLLWLLLGMALIKILPRIVDFFSQTKGAEIRARIDADAKEREVDLKQSENTFGTLNEFTRTLLANQLQSSKQFQEEVASILQLQNQQIGLILQLLQDSKRNQERFFELADQIKASIAELKLEIEKNRKVYQVNNPSVSTQKPPQTPPQLPPLSK
ncbi:hypothetical protein [Pseudanabaena sp. PCC 6802]|uniref:hypothetical protein n=1 Tax=Pseudanabaena sp. PCC 6802 TaxID=118173 RepID=UPI00034C3A1E|nr:hypothetical protein [Pseudanabaena sp. PCC 6802]